MNGNDLYERKSNSIVHRLYHRTNEWVWFAGMIIGAGILGYGVASLVSSWGL